MTNSRLTFFSSGIGTRILGSTIPIIVFLFASLCFQQTAQAQCAPVCKHINVSLDQMCEATITTSMVLDSSGCPNGVFELQLEYANGNVVPTSPTIDRSELGQIIARVTDTVSGNVCWSYITVEDKLGPAIECSPDTVDCIELASYINEGPEVTDNCFRPWEISVAVVDSSVDGLSCDPNFISVTTITWQATDGSGMTAECDQQIYVTRIDSALIEFPRNRVEANDSALICSNDYDLNDDGVIDWQITGAPIYNGQHVLAPNDDGSLKFYPECNIGVKFVDTDFGLINCRRKIMRLWTVQEWWCSDELEWTMPQLIEIVDTTGPSITCPGDLTVTTSSGECDAQVYLPAATATDDCSAIVRYDVAYPGGFLSGQNGGLVTLPVGQHRITYSVYDECLNRDTCSMYVTVADNTAPVAICDNYTVVSLTNNGKARVYAETFDDGSWDECGIDRFEVRRMTAACGYDDLFRDYVEFSCCDLGDPIMVVFRVWDLAGNYNDCMVEVTVQDKLAPFIVCPADVTISCSYPYSIDNLDEFGVVHALDSFGQLNNPLLDPRQDIVIEDPDNPNVTNPYTWGQDGYAFGSCGVTVTSDATPYLNQCGTGFIYRVFTVTNASGQSASCAQTISVKDFTPFGYDNIDWPEDADVDGTCGADVDPSVTGRPTYDGNDCEMVAVSDPEDWVFNFNDPTQPACFKILRTWKVIDWCQHDPLTGEGLWTHTQVIKVNDTTGPQITGCDDVSICSYDQDCQDAHVDISITPTDSCTEFEALAVSYVIDVDSDGTFDLSSSNNPYADAGNAKNVASGTYPIGKHRIVWSVLDGCGNETTCSSTILVENCTAPVAYCLNGLAADLTPIDQDNDGNYDWAELEIWASDFDAGSYHSCYDEVVVSFSADTSDTSIMFNCDSIGRRYVQLWATAPNGQQSYCIAFIDIQDNNNVCPPGSGNDSLSGDLVGRIYTEMGDNMNETMVYLIGGDTEDMTDAGGNYSFNDMPFGGTYQLDPEKDDHYLNGVTANDLSIIQRHVAAIEDLTSPYKHFAADANNDDVLDIVDVLVLRKLLLGIETEIPNQKPWMFLDASCTFGTDPLTSECAEVYEIPTFEDDMVVDFIGIKIGDVDNDAIVNLQGGAESRTNRAITLEVMDQMLEAGQRYEIPVTIANDAAVRAIQLTYALNPGSAILHNVRAEGMTSAAFNTTLNARGLASQVWADANEVVFGDDATVVIEFTAIEDVRLSEVLEVTSQVTEAMAFDNEGAMKIDLRFNESTDNADHTFALMQNRPNPFTGQTTIGFVLPDAATVSLTITDVSGREVFRTVQDFEGGINEINIEKADLRATGVMYYRLETGKYSATKKMILLD